MKRRAVLAGLALIAGAASVMADDQAFLAAARDNDAEALTKLLAAGQPVDARDSGGRTALLVATHPMQSMRRGC